MKIGEVFGNSHFPEIWKFLKSIASSGKSMFIDFKKQIESKPWYDENSKFIALIKYEKIDFVCQKWLDVDKNILVSPNNPNKTNCSWVITANFGSYIILNFKFIEVNKYFLNIK